MQVQEASPKIQTFYTSGQNVRFSSPVRQSMEVIPVNQLQKARPVQQVVQQSVMMQSPQRIARSPQRVVMQQQRMESPKRMAMHESMQLQGQALQVQQAQAQA